MNPFFLAAAALAIVCGALHSWLGERYILIRLFRRTDLPKLFGSDLFTRRTLRFAWHLTTIAWWGFAAQLFRFSRVHSMDGPAGSAVEIVAWTFLASSIASLVWTRGRHLSWVLFLGIAVSIWLGIRLG